MSKQNGSTLIIVAVIVAVLGAATVVFLAARQQSNKTTTSSSAATPPTNTSTKSDQSNQSSQSIAELQRNSKNVSRKNDASRLMAGVEEFISNNAGTLPTGAQGLQLTGAAGTLPTDVQLTLYKSFTLVSGKQPKLASDSIQVVTQATCQPDGTTVASSATRAFVVQYSQQNADASFTTGCISQ